MVIDTSVLLAIFMGEPERKRFLDLIPGAERRLISAANALEAGLVLKAKRGEAAGREFDLFLQRAQIEVVAVDFDQVTRWHGWRGACTEKDAIPRLSISATVSLMHGQEPPGNRFWPKELISVQTDLDLCAEA